MFYFIPDLLFVFLVTRLPLCVLSWLVNVDGPHLEFEWTEWPWYSAQPTFKSFQPTNNRWLWCKVKSQNRKSGFSFLFLLFFLRCLFCTFCNKFFFLIPTSKMRRCRGPEMFVVAVIEISIFYVPSFFGGTELLLSIGTALWQNTSKLCFCRILFFFSSLVHGKKVSGKIF